MEHIDLTAHLDWLFRQAMALTRNTADAQELTQEALLSALATAAVPANERGFLLTVLRRRHADMLRRKYRLPTVSIDCAADLPEAPVPDDGEDAARVRQAVAFLADKYREAIVRHYLRGEPVADIAADLHLPKGTVLSRLSAGRDQIRKGWNDMEDYGRQSSQPERLDVSCNGRPGLHDEPWSLVAGDLMKQNILIAAYDAPVTPVEIARHLGIPAAYVEAAVEALVRGGLMQRAGSKVFTDFIITTPAQREKGVAHQIDLVRVHYEKVMTPVRAMTEAVRASECHARLQPDEQRKLREYFAVHLLSTAIFTAARRIVPAEEVFPERPDGGSWIASGYRVPVDYDWEDNLFRRYTYHGEQRATWEYFMDSRRITLRCYDVQPELNRYQHGPVGMDIPTLCRLLYIIHRGLNVSDTGIDPALMQNIPNLIDCHVLRDAGGRPECSVPVLTPAEYAALDAVRVAQLHLLADVLEPLLRAIFPQLRVPLPAHLSGRVAEFRRYSCYAIPMALREECIRRGEWPDGEGGPAMVLLAE